MKRGWKLLGGLLAVIALCLTLWFLWWWQGNRLPSSGMCTPSDLSLSIGRTDGTAGIAYVHAVVTNKGNRICALNGYPTVSLLDNHGTRLGLGDAQDNTSFAPTAIVLTPMAQAYVALGIPDAGNFTSDNCSITSTTLRLYLPGNIIPGTVPLTTPLAKQVCPGFSVTAFQAGS